MNVHDVRYDRVARPDDNGVEVIRTLADLAQFHHTEAPEGVKPELVVTSIGAQVYRYTECGAWVEIHLNGGELEKFRYGSIVEMWEGDTPVGEWLYPGVSAERAGRQIDRINNCACNIHELWVDSSGILPMERVFPDQATRQYTLTLISRELTLVEEQEANDS